MRKPTGYEEPARAIDESDSLAADRPAIPPKLAEMAPGILLAAVLSNTDVNWVSGHDRVIVMAPGALVTRVDSQSTLQNDPASVEVTA